MSTPEERFKETNCLVKELGFGHAAFVHLFITKNDAENILDWYRSNIIDEQEAFLRLRQALRTVKILDQQDGVNFEDEFVAYYHSNRMHHPNLAEILPGQNDHFRKEWFEIEGLPAGTLETYTEAVSKGETFDHAPPVAFGWHILHQLCEALLAFQFSAGNNPAPMGGWPMFFHGDPTAANMLFRKPSRETNATSFPGYPDIVLCDLGEARELRNSEDHGDFFHQQYEDVRIVLEAIKALFSIRPVNQHAMFAQEVQSYIDRLHQTEAASGHGNKNAALQNFLSDLSSSAKAGRLFAHGIPGSAEALEPKAVAYFDRGIISDERLGRFWMKLRDGQINDSYDPRDDD